MQAGWLDCDQRYPKTSTESLEIVQDAQINYVVALHDPDLLPDTAKLSKAPEEAEVSPKDPFYQEVTYARAFSIPVVLVTDSRPSQRLGYRLRGQ